jgi:hypothetical protein
MLNEHRRHFGSWRAAMRQLVDDMGGAAKMAKAMWPKRSVSVGQKTINDWLNCKRRETPDFEEIELMLSVGRAHGIHVAINELCDRLNYSRVIPVDPKEKLDALGVRIQQQQAALEESIDQYKRLKFEFDIEHTPRFKP